jgi:DNA-binding beta-propeller fold protein YncE
MIISIFLSCSVKQEVNTIPAIQPVPEIPPAEIVIEEAEPIPEPAPVLEPLPPAFSFRVKTGPAEVALFSNGEELIPTKTAVGVREYVINDDESLISFQAENYITQEMNPREIPGNLRRGILQIKLEPAVGIFHLVQEIETGSQPKSAMFSADGKRIFVPLLNETGVDVFSLNAENNPPLQFEKRITVPEENAVGFVESYIDVRRNEYLVSNMDENKVHIFDLTTLEYKTSFSTGGTMPKVIAQNPSGTITVVSNWLDHTIALFNSETRERTALINVGATPRGMSFSPDGSLLYAALFDGPNIAVIDMNQKKLIKTFSYSTTTGAARHVLFHNEKLYVSDMYQGRVYILQAADGKVLHSLRVGPNVNTICFSADKSILFVSSRGRNNPDDYTIEGPEFGTVTALNSSDLSAAGKVWGRNQPTGLAASPDGKYLVFTDFLDANMELYSISK